MTAIHSGNVDIVNALIKAGAKIEKQDIDVSIFLAHQNFPPQIYWFKSQNGINQGVNKLYCDTRMFQKCVASNLL